MSLNFAEMKSFCRFLIVVLGVATSVLPSVYAEDCSFYCQTCLEAIGCNKNMEFIINYCVGDKACVVVTEGKMPECRPLSETPCHCNENSRGCDPYDNMYFYHCSKGNLGHYRCPPGTICTGNGACTDYDEGSGGEGLGEGGEGSGPGGEGLGPGGESLGEGGEGSGPGGEGSGPGGEGLGEGGEGSGPGGEGSGPGGEGSGPGGEDSGTTKPATCSADNANTRYPHETDYKKFYLCLELTPNTYLFVELTCPWNLVYNKVTTYCDEPENVPDCQQ